MLIAQRSQPAQAWAQAPGWWIVADAMHVPVWSSLPKNRVRDPDPFTLNGFRALA